MKTKERNIKGGTHTKRALAGATALVPVPFTCSRGPSLKVKEPNKETALLPLGMPSLPTTGLLNSSVLQAVTLNSLTSLVSHHSRL